MKRRVLIPAVLFACLLAGQTNPTSAKPERPQLRPPCYGAVFTVDQIRAFSAEVWATNRWQRGRPPERIVRAALHKFRCAAGPGHRTAGEAIWLRKRAAYFQHRRYELEVEALTPYGPWAIPEAVVDCESGGDWGAVNEESGARGPYQLLPSTYYGVCRSCDWSHLDQHYAAGIVWARSGGSEWVCSG